MRDITICVIICVVTLYACFSSLVFMAAYGDQTYRGITNPFKSIWSKYKETLNTAGIIILEILAFIFFFPGWVLLWFLTGIIILITLICDLFFEVFKRRAK